MLGMGKWEKMPVRIKYELNRLEARRAKYLEVLGIAWQYDRPARGP
jgi:hypothetical protein